MYKRLISFTILCVAIALPTASLPQSHGQGGGKKNPKSKYGELIFNIKIDGVAATEEGVFLVDTDIKVEAEFLKYNSDFPVAVWFDNFPGFETTNIPETPTNVPNGIKQDPPNTGQNWLTMNDMPVSGSSTGEETTLVIWAKYAVSTSPEIQSLYVRRTLKFVAKSTSRAAAYGSEECRVPDGAYPAPARRGLFPLLRRGR